MSSEVKRVVSSFPRPVAKSFAALVAGASLVTTAAFAYETCAGCSIYLPTQMPGEDPCWIAVWTIVPDDGACALDSPTCLQSQPCSIDYSWTVVVNPFAPGNCPSSGDFSWAASWGSGSSASGTAPDGRATDLDNLRLPCDSDFQLTVTNAATQASVLEFVAVCNACSAG